MCKVGRGYATEKRRETFQLGLIVETKGWEDGSDSYCWRMVGFGDDECRAASTVQKPEYKIMAQVV